MPALVGASGTLKFSDLDGRYDGAMLNETSPLDGDTPLSNLSCEPTTPQYGLSETMYTDFLTIDAEVYGVNGSLEIAGRETRIVPETVREEVVDWAVFSSSVISGTDFYDVNYCFESTDRSNLLKSDIDGNFILDRWEAQGELTRIDGKPPTYIKWGGSYVHVSITANYDSKWKGKISTSRAVIITVKVQDGAGIAYIEFWLEGEGKKVLYVENGMLELTASMAFNCDENRAMWNGWDLRVRAYDRNGNYNETKKIHIDGVIQGIIKAIISGFLGLLEAIKKLASKVFDWIWNAITLLIKKAFKSIIDAINDFINTIKNAFIVIKALFKGGIDTGNIISACIAMVKIFSHSIFYCIVAIEIIIAVIILLTLPFRVIVIGLSAVISEFIGPLIIGLLGAVLKSSNIDFQKFDLFGYIIGMLPSATQSTIGRESICCAVSELIVAIIGAAIWFIFAARTLNGFTNFIISLIFAGVNFIASVNGGLWALIFGLLSLISSFCALADFYGIPIKLPEPEEKPDWEPPSIESTIISKLKFVPEGPPPILPDVIKHINEILEKIMTSLEKDPNWRVIYHGLLYVGFGLAIFSFIYNIQNWR